VEDTKENQSQSYTPHLKRVRVNVRIQRWMLDQLKAKGEIGFFLEAILKNAGFKYWEDQKD